MMKLTDDNFILYAMRHYDNPQCHTIQEFEEDLKRFLYIRKLLNRYKKEGELRERLILNHVVVLYNLFGDAVTNMLFFKIDRQDWPALVPFLVYINRMPDTIEQHSIKSSDIQLDQIVIAALRKI